MKKVKLVSLGTLFLGIASFIASPTGAIARENNNNSEVSNKTLPDDGNLFRGLKFEKLEILKDFSVPITEKEGVKEILSKHIDEVYAPFNRKLKSSPSISYRIVHEGDRLSFTNFKVVEGKSDDKQDKPPVLSDDCPDGLDLIEVCYSRSCVKETLEKLEGSFSSGDTIYIHHNGFGGVIICSDVSIR